MSEFNELLHDALQKAKRQTNADRIRGMSDEELAEFLERWTARCYLPTKACEDYEPCVSCLVEWLKAPAEGGVT